MAGVVQGGRNSTKKRRTLFCSMMLLLMGIMAIGPQSAFAGSQAQKDFPSENLGFAEGLDSPEASDDIIDQPEINIGVGDEGLSEPTEANKTAETYDSDENLEAPLEYVDSADAPYITTGYATSVSRSTAVITNAISLEHEPVQLESCGLEVGSDIALDNPLVFYAASRTDRSFTVDLEGLEEGTIYYYRCFYETDQGFLYGTVRSFSTISRPL